MVPGIQKALKYFSWFQSVQLLSHVWLFTTPWTAARQALLFLTISQGLLKLMSITSVMPSNHLILCRPLLLLPSIFPNIRVFSNESALRIRGPKCWSFSFNPSNEYSGLFSFRMDWLISLQSKGLSRVFSNTTVQKHQKYFWLDFCASSKQEKLHSRQVKSREYLRMRWVWLSENDRLRALRTLKKSLVFLW